MADNKRYYWMKFQSDFFKSLRIKKLRRLAGGDTFTIIYLKLQLLSLSNEGYLEYKGVFEDFETEMAEEIDEDVENIKLTLQYLLINELMIQEEPNVYYLPYASQNVGSETASTQRSRECRLRKKEQKALQCNTNATLMQRDCNVEIEKEKEIEIDIDKEYIDISSDEDILVDSETESTDSQRERIDYKSIFNEFNRICVSLPKVNLISDKRQKAIKARIKTYGQEKIIEAFEKAEASDFLKGKNNRNWSADFDWIMKDSNMAKILDGNYDNNRKAGRYAGDGSRTETETSRWDTEGKQYYGLKI